MAKKALVTGGCGFIGTWLVRALLDRGYEVTTLDSGIQKIAEHKQARNIEGLTIDTRLLQELVPKHDEIYHLAATVGTSLINKGPEFPFVDLAGTMNLIAICADNKKPLLITSSSEAYGVSDGTIAEDSVSTFEPYARNKRMTYGLCKFCGDSYALAYSTIQQAYRLNVRIARLFNVVGPFQTPQSGMVLPRFISWALQDKDIEIYDWASREPPVRTFLDVRDCCNYLLAMMKSVPSSTVLNIAGETRLSIKDLAEQVKAACNSGSKIIHVEPPWDKDFHEIPRGKPDTSKLQEYFPKHELIPWKETLNDTIHWLKENPRYWI